MSTFASLLNHTSHWPGSINSHQGVPCTGLLGKDRGHLRTVGASPVHLPSQLEVYLCLYLLLRLLIACLLMSPCMSTWSLWDMDRPCHVLSTCKLKHTVGKDQSDPRRAEAGPVCKSGAVTHCCLSSDDHWVCQVDTPAGCSGSEIPQSLENGRWRPCCL
jgi:hypothetical protein